MINPVSSSIGQTSLQGMQNAEVQFQSAANRIAKLPGVAQDPQSPDTVDLSTDMVALMSARDNFMANVGAAKAGDELQRALLNIVA